MLLRDETKATMKATHLSSVWIPAEDPVVFSATQQELRVSLVPRYRQNSPVRRQQRGH